jgi:5-methylcytosine-specific restriction protein A
MPRIGVQERKDQAAAAEVIKAVFARVPDGARQSYIEFLVGVIRYLVSRHNDRWGITLFDWGVRLNVGWVECLVLHSGGLRVLVDKDVAQADTTFDGVNYKRAPGCEMTTIPLSDLPKALPSLEESHYAALSRAANWQSPPNIRGAHSVGVTKLLSLPDPSYVSSAQDPVFVGSDEEAAPAVFLEGGRVAVLVNRFERDPSAREACIAFHGLRCSVCGMSFGERYGETMKDVIHVHHLVALSAVGMEFQIDPTKDLRPVCPNCHSVIHHGASPLTIEQARALLLPSKP